MNAGTDKLFKVTLKGLHSVTSTGYNENYVIAKNPSEAYSKVLKFLNENDLGFDRDRELKSIELVAECCEYTYTNHHLFL